MKEPGSDLIFEKYKKISTPTTQRSGGRLTGSEKLRCAVGSPHLRDTRSTHAAGSIQDSERGLKAVCFQHSEFTEDLIFCN